MDYRYFKAAGRSLEIVREVQRQRHDAAKARSDYARERGAAGYYGTDGSFIGIYFDGEATQIPGWRLSREGDKRKPVMVPDDRTKPGRAVRAEMNNKARFEMPGVMEFGERLGCPWAITPGHAYFPTFEPIGDVVVIRVPDLEQLADFTPPDAEPMKASEYWALREAHQPAEASV